MSELPPNDGPPAKPKSSGSGGVSRKNFLQGAVGAGVGGLVDRRRRRVCRRQLWLVELLDAGGELAGRVEGHHQGWCRSPRDRPVRR